MKKQALFGLLLTVLVCLNVLNTNGQENKVFWETANQVQNAINQTDNQEQSFDGIENCQILQLNEKNLQSHLKKAPNRENAIALKNQEDIIIEMPMPEGGTKSFKMAENAVLSEELAKKFPGVNSYVGVGVEDPTASLRLAISNEGIKAVIFSNNHKTVFVTDYDEKNYIAYYKNDFYKNNETKEFSCGVQIDENTAEKNNNNFKFNNGDCQLRTYRLALACTGEYAQYHGGTVNSVISEMNATMTMVNGIFERELGVKFQLVGNNNQLIYLNPTTDPYDNYDFEQMLGVNQLKCDQLIGNSNYDIGHVFGTAGGGLASVYSICSPFAKAYGATGISNPTGDVFVIDYVAHELGHQLGADHTQNNDCNRWIYSSVEPGSGSTIMSYSGVCAPNVVTYSDDYFHSLSLQTMGENIVDGYGSTCANLSDLGNNAPIVDAGKDQILPISTSFVLNCEAYDADDDAMSYCWEQMDIQIATMPPVSNSITGPAFRSFPPNANSERHFPTTTAQIANVDPTWEELPSVGRTMNFRCTVRDNHFGVGCIASDDVKLTFTSTAGPFKVKTPNTNLIWQVGATKSISWDVANTNNSLVNCQKVDIFLSTDGGYTYPIKLAKGVANDGSHSIVVPNVVGANNRIKIKAVDNVFYDISNTNFSIVPCNNCDDNLDLNVKVYLQGALVNSNNGLMRDDLRQLGYLPYSNPFEHVDGISAFDNNDVVLPNYLMNVSGQNAIVDWVLLELRPSNNITAPIASKAVLLQRDGDLMAIDGSSTISFENMEKGQYYVCIQHRNHLSIMTQAAQYLGTGTTYIDFSDGTTADFGDNAQANIDGVNAMWLGNTNSNGEVIYQGGDNDSNETFFAVVNAPQNHTKVSNYIQSGYSQGDVNLDGRVIYQGSDNDPNLIFFNILTHPLNPENLANYIIKEQVPIE